MRTLKNLLVSFDYIIEYLKSKNPQKKKSSKSKKQATVSQQNKESPEVPIMTNNIPPLKANIDPTQMIMMLVNEVNILKASMAQLSEEIKVNPNQGQIKVELPPDIMTLDNIRVNPCPKKVFSNTQNPELVKVQSLIRGVLVRQRLKKYKFQEYCVTKIQAWIKGYLLRKKQKALKALSKKTECKKCKKNEEEIISLRKEVAELKSTLKEYAKIGAQHEKALKYLFSQIKILAEAKHPRTEDKRSSKKGKSNKESDFE